MDEKTSTYINSLIKQSIKKNRGYASYFEWPDKDQKEVGVTLCLFESLEKNTGELYSGLFARGEGNDPPDCEAKNNIGEKIGIEVTELVDENGIKNHISGNTYDWAEWNKEKLLNKIQERILAKDKPNKVKGGPYSKYILLIHTDEPDLPYKKAKELLKGTKFLPLQVIDEIFLLFSYDTDHEACPYIHFN